MVTFVVEDGSGVAFANSYVTLDEADDYLSIKGASADAWIALTDEEKEEYLMWATRLLDQRADFEGHLTYTDPLQTLRWPRSGVMGRDCISVEIDVIPNPIKAATIEIAWHLFSQQVDPSLGTSTGSGEIKRIKADVLEIEYQVSGDVDTVSPFPKGINAILWPLGSLAITGTSNAVKILKA